LTEIFIRDIEGFMKKKCLAITFYLNLSVVISFMAMSECRSESIATDGSIPKPQWVYLLDTDQNVYTVSNDSLNIEDKKALKFSKLSFWNLNPAKTPLYFFPVCQGVESQLLAVNPARSPRPPPSDSL
jgi:hypothetical protein